MTSFNCQDEKPLDEKSDNIDIFDQNSELNVKQLKTLFSICHRNI